jgi:hypothetical protein
MSAFNKRSLCETALGSVFSVSLWFGLEIPGSQTQFGNPCPKTPFRGKKSTTIFENLTQFGTPFQKVFCHSAKSRTPLAEYFSCRKALKYNYLSRSEKVSCHSANPQRKPKNEDC